MRSMDRLMRFSGPFSAAVARRSPTSFNLDVRFTLRAGPWVFGFETPVSDAEFGRMWGP